MFARNNHRRGAKAVLGKYGGDRGIVFNSDHQQIFASRFFDIGLGNT